MSRKRTFIVHLASGACRIVRAMNWHCVFDMYPGAISIAEANF